jgi:MFS family permease
MSDVALQPAAPNAKRLLWAGFMAILAAGVGFAIRSALLQEWGGTFGFTDAQKGDINGAGFTGFCFGIIIGGFVADKIGYGKLVMVAFGLHVLSAFVAFGATDGMENAKAFNFLYWGSFLFAIANGTLEAVANPLVATLFPNNRAHYLNILHASWPAGMVLGGAAVVAMGTDGILSAEGFHWKYKLGLFLIPTVIYGLMFMGQKMPRSEASEKGLSLADMLKDVGLGGGMIVCYLISLFFASILGPMLTPENANAEQALSAASTASYIGYGIGAILLAGIGVITRFSLGSPLLFVLFFAHALVGAVELGTDGWIQNITGSIFSPTQGTILFIFTSAIMFGLRFCAEFIEKKIGLSPVGLLLVCAILACIGLNLTSMVNTFPVALVALGVYAFGKTFFWPTMLAVASDRFPRTGAVAISIMGGIGMMSAGLIGSAGLGYFKDRYSGEELVAAAETMADDGLVDRYKAAKPSKFLFFDEATGIDNVKLEAIAGELADLRKENPEATLADLDDEKETVAQASIKGSRRTLVTDSLIPATMAVIYLLMALYFKSIGGYKPLSITEEEELAADIAAGEFSEA